MSEQAVQEIPRTIADALEAYGIERLGGSSPNDGLDAVLHIVGTFCDELAGELVDAFAKRRIARQGPGAAPTGVLDPGTLLRVLTPCARLFPYQIVAGAGVVNAFVREVPRLARWLARNELGASADAARFRTGWSTARPDLVQHARLQEAIEVDLFGNPPAFTEGGDDADTIIGRFHVRRVTPAGLWVQSNGDLHGPVRVPRGVAGLYHEGWDASLAFRRAVVGWRLLASALPSAPGTLDRLLSEFAVRACG